MGKKENKRKKYFRASSGKKARIGRESLDAGMQGFLLTCANAREKECVREGYSILNLYAERLYGPEKLQEDESEASDADDDPDAAVEKEVAAIKNSGRKVRRFQAVDSGGKNVVFIKTTLEKPAELTDSLFADVLQTKSCPSVNICRLLPIVATCKAHMENILKTAEKTLAPFFQDIPHSYSINIKIRNNNSLSRNLLLPQLGDIMKSLNCDNRVDLTNPDFVISIEVITNICCVGVMKKFSEYRKYNLQELACKINEEKLNPEKDVQNSTGSTGAQPVLSPGDNPDGETKDHDDGVQADTNDNTATETNADTRDESNTNDDNTPCHASSATID